MNAVIRLATTADADAILRIYAPIVRDSHISFEQNVPALSEMASRVERTLAQYPWLVCELDGQFAGYAYASAFRSRAAYQWTAETTVYVHADFQRRGVSKALYSALLALLREQGYCQAVGVIALPNAGSIRAHEALGFRKIGVFENIGYKDGAWRHTGWWQLELRPPHANPQPPRPLPCLRAASDIDDLLRSGLRYLKR